MPGGATCATPPGRCPRAASTGEKRRATANRSFVSKVLNKTRFVLREQHLLILAVDEAVTRSTTAEGDYEISLKLTINDVCFKAEVVDSKNDYALPLSGPKMSKNWRNEQHKKDLGIFVILEIMDEVKYVYRRGFNNIFAKNYAELNLGGLQKAIDNKKLDVKKPITVEILRTANVVGKVIDGVRLLAKGKLKTKVDIHVTGASKAAVAAVEAAGGKITLPAATE